MNPHTDHQHSQPHGIAQPLSVSPPHGIGGLSVLGVTRPERRGCARKAALPDPSEDAG